MPPHFARENSSDFIMNRKTAIVLTTLCAAAFLMNTPCLAQENGDYAITVEAGSYDRHWSVVTFTMPDGLFGDRYVLAGEDGQVVPLQIDDDRTATFILDSLMAGETRRYRIRSIEGNERLADERVSVIDDEGSVSITESGQPVLTYHYEKTPLPRPDIPPIFQRGGYIHPVYTPNGLMLTDDYPPNHLHHHGIWAAWTRTVFEGRTPDFWNMGDSTGFVEPVGLEETWSGPVRGGLRASNQYVDLTGGEPKVALDEVWEVNVYPMVSADRPVRVFDIEIVQYCHFASPLVLPEYHYGGVGFRGHRDWNGADNAVFLTSEGLDRSNGHATRARWCHIGGLVDGQMVGIAVLDHPQNFRSPQPMRIHPDEPFFNYAPSQMGDWAIDPGQPYNVRYRFLTYDGEPDPDLIDRFWYDYAFPVVVRVSEP